MMRLTPETMSDRITVIDYVTHPTKVITLRLDVMTSASP